MARKRFLAHLRRQDWTAVAIDFVILVLGVFVGIQASNWNDDRKDRRTGDAYLHRIRSDLGYDLNGLRQRDDYWRQTASAGDRALRFAEEGQLDSDQWATLLDFYTAGQIWNYSPTDGTYREMLNAGRLDLLTDPRLKLELSVYYIGRQTQGILFDTLPPYREDIRAAVPYRFQRYILERCQGAASPSVQLQRCPPPPDRTGLAELNRRIAGDPKLMGELRSWMTTLHYTRGVGLENQQNAARLIARIDSERS